MGLSPNDHAILRQPHHTHEGSRLLTVNAVPMAIVASALINAAEFLYPVVQLAVDDTSPDWLTETQVGRMVMIGTAPGAHDVTVGVVRKVGGGSTLLINPLYPGDTMFAQDIRQALEDDLYVSIVKYRPPFGMGSIIRKGVFYKDWDTAYTDAGLRPFDLVNMGSHQQADVDPVTGLARFTITIQRYHWEGNSYASHVWGVDGQTVISQDDSELVIDCVPGCHEITYSLTNNRGKVTTAYRYLFANHPTLYPAFNDVHDVTVDSQQDRQGCTFTISIHDPLSIDTIYPGQLWLMTTHPRWGNPVTQTYTTVADLDDPASVATNFVGYVAEGSIRTSRTERETVLTVEAPIRYSKSVPVEKQIIIEKRTPRNWSEVSPVLSNPVGMFYYLCMFHARWLINGHDFNFEPIILNLRRQIQNLDSDVTLGGQLEQLATFLDGEGNIGSDTSGATWMLRNPVYWNTGARNQLPDRFNWSADDLASEIERPLRFRPQVGKTFAGGFGFAGGSESSAWRSMAPGYVRSQAGGEVSLPDTTIVHGQGQSRVNEISGFHHARLNRRSSAFQFTVNGIIDVADPVRLDEWHTLSVPVGYDPLGEGWTNVRFHPLSVTRQWSGPGGNRYEITVEAEPESFGFPGITVPINNGAASSWVSQPLPKWFDPYIERTPSGLDIPENWNMMGAWNDLYFSARSHNFGHAHTGWERLVPYVMHMEPNWHSPYFSNPDDPLEMLVLTVDPKSGIITLNTIADWFAEEPSITPISTWTVGHDVEYPTGHVVVDPVEDGYWVVVWRSMWGVIHTRSTDTGATWTMPTSVGGGIVPTVEDINDPINIALYDQHLIISDRNDTRDVHGNLINYVWQSTSKASPLTKINNPPDHSVVSGAVEVLSPNTYIVPLVKWESPTPANPLDVVTFDLGGYPDYTVSGGYTDSGINGSLWYPDRGNMAYGATLSSSNDACFCVVDINLDAYYTLNQLSFWIAKLDGVTAENKRWEIVIVLEDEDGTVIRRHGVTGTDDEYDEATVTVTSSDFGLTGSEQIWRVRIMVRYAWDHLSGANYTYVFVDDIDIDADLVEYASDRALWIYGSGSWSKSHSFQAVPFHHFGIAADRNNGIVTAVVRDEYGNQASLIESTNGGQTWTRIRQMYSIVGLKRSGDKTVLFGHNALLLSLDGGQTAYNMLGDWASRVSPVNKIRGVAGVM